MAGFANAFEAVAKLAEAAPGFVRRLGADGHAVLATSAGAEVVVNVSVWSDYRTLHEFVYRSAHGRFLLRRRGWFARASPDHPHPMPIVDSFGSATDSRPFRRTSPMDWTGDAPQGKAGPAKSQWLAHSRHRSHASAAETAPFGCAPRLCRNPAWEGRGRFGGRGRRRRW
ncbi:DUF3291 domain-containing protein [Amycolatopsis sp. NPDC005961]|uniref:DUF3291 domain-containing protein n=1 Tax=Amycolatopsis sp. NPDC005961 TaxID=3156720 RepID=UPI003409BF68